MSKQLFPKSRIYVAGHRGLAGSAILRKLQSEGFENIITRTSQELDLTNQQKVKTFFQEEKPEYVFLCAAKVGGILANSTYPATFIHQNLMIQSHVIHEAKENDVKRLLFLGSSCIYPRDCPQPIKEEYLLTGPLEPTNRAYAVAKIAGIEMCHSYNRQYNTRFVAAMPTNLYGVGDHYDLQNSHVLPAIMRKMHDAKERNEKTITLWGSGQVRREFLHSDDLAEAVVFLMQLSEDKFTEISSSKERSPLVNIGCGEDLTIKELSRVVAQAVEFDGEIVWDRSKPDGTPRKLLDISYLKSLGWAPKISLEEGIKSTYQNFTASQVLT